MDYVRKNEQNLMANISTTMKNIKKQLHSVVDNGVSYLMLCSEAKENCFWGVDSFRMVEELPFDAIFGPIQKIVHNSKKLN